MHVPLLNKLVIVTIRQLLNENRQSNAYTTRGEHTRLSNSAFRYIKPNSKCNYTFQIDLAPNGISFGSSREIVDKIRFNATRHWSWFDCKTRPKVCRQIERSGLLVEALYVFYAQSDPLGTNCFQTGNSSSV